MKFISLSKMSHKAITKAARLICKKCRYKFLFTQSSGNIWLLTFHTRKAWARSTRTNEDLSSFYARWIDLTDVNAVNSVIDEIGSLRVYKVSEVKTLK